MKFRAHETFFVRKGWLNKGIKYVSLDPAVFVSKDKNPMDVLGIGSNMVKSLRYWIQAVGITQEPKSGKREQSFTRFGNLVKEYDPYIEELGTLYLLHYNLVKNYNEASSWYYFYNIFNMSSFTKNEFVEGLQKFVRDKGEEFAIRSYEDDFACILNTYIPRYKTNPSRVSPESNIDCPLGELGLIDIIDVDKSNSKKDLVYKKAIPLVSTVNPWIALAIIKEQAVDEKEVQLNSLLNDPMNIGKVLNLDAITMLEILHNIEKLGEIKIIRTAGLDVIRINSDKNYYDCIEEYYKSIEE